MISKMLAIEYNVLMTLISLIDNRMRSGVASEYGLVGTVIHVLPSYPRDLTKMKKPSIIIRKVNTDSNPIGMGGVLGQHFDTDTNTLMDVNGIYHNTTVQIDVVTDDNTTGELIVSAITEGILYKILFEEDTQVKLYNYIDLSNIQEMGWCKLRNEVSITNVEESSMDHDYTTAIRFDIDTVQAIVPVQELIDLSKWIKINYKINQGGNKI